uniref:Uncharacterized protein n=1 Tax=Anguilla anguilla TaxID=7936 RepID=A0A0E9R4R0_ANGAN
MSHISMSCAFSHKLLTHELVTN